MLNLGGVGPTDDGGWSQPVVRTRQPYSVETAKLKNKPVSNITLLFFFIGIVMNMQCI